MAFLLDPNLARQWFNACRLSQSLRAVALAPTGLRGDGEQHTVPTLAVCLQGVVRVRLAQGQVDLQADEAVLRAHTAFGTWRRVAPADRARLLRRFSDVVDAHLEELALLEVLNSGHTIGNARWEAGNVRDVLAYYSAAPERMFGRQIPVANGIDVTFMDLGVHRVAIGLVASIAGVMEKLANRARVY